MEVSVLEESDEDPMLIRVALQNGLPAYGDPRVIEGRFFQVQQDWADLRHQQNLTLGRVATNEDEVQVLLVNFNTLKKDFEHFIVEHYNPMQKLGDEWASATCRSSQVVRLGRRFVFRRQPSISTGSGSSSAPDLDSLSSSSKDKGSFKTSRSEVQGVSSSPGNLDAAGGVGSQAGVGVWDGHGEMGAGEGSSEEECSSSPGLVQGLQH